MRPLLQPLHEPLPVDVTLTTHAPILGTPTLQTLRWADEADCQRFAAACAARPAWRDAIVELRGPLGAGKTTFVRHLLRALGVQGRIKSPTYAVVEPYALPGLDVWHFDFYRFADPREWDDAGFRELYGARGLKLAEWPEKVAGVLPAPDLRLTLEPLDETARSVRAEAFTPRGRELLA